jgi:hypothetical protein
MHMHTLVSKRVESRDHLLCHSSVRRSFHVSESWYKYPATSALPTIPRRQSDTR